MSAAGLLANRYEPVEVVGRGGQGHVLRAWDRHLGKQVAVKLRPAGPADDRAALAAEAGALLGLTPHRGLPVVRDDFFDGDRYCLVMDWVDGDTLQARLDGHPGGLPLDEVLAVLDQLASALDHLHSHDPPVVHGDVKPANVLVGADGRAVLVDFGVARRDPNAPALAGTRGYAAPELALGQSLSAAADIFSMAATAFALLTGGPPSPGVRPSWRRVAGRHARRVEFALRRGLALDPTRRPASATAFVAALSGEAPGPTNLPVELDTFVGRQRALAELKADLGRSPLLTLIGPGGVGKSRLARQLAAELLPEHADGAYLVELAPLSDPALVPDQTLVALGVRPDPGGASLDALATYLRDRHLLLVIDNCEHLVSGVAAIVERLVNQCPHLRVVATSRQPLGLASELRRTVEPLTAPAAGEEDVQTLARCEAVQLFVERAAQARPDFSLTTGNGPAVAQICRRLDGIPLALELAAARTNALSPSELARRMDDRFRLLRSDAGAGPARHRTLLAAVAWSYDALDEVTQRLFARLSVFAGGFDADAAQDVAAGEGTERDDIPRLLGVLLDRSLLSAEETDDGTIRYRLLETLRQYGSERLAASGTAGDVRRRHLGWVLSVAEPVFRSQGTPDATKCRARADRELDNVRQALSWALEADPVSALRIVGFLGLAWATLGYLAEGRRWTTAALQAAPDAPLDARALATLRAASLAGFQGERELATSFAQEALAMFRMLGDHQMVASTLFGTLGPYALERGDIEEAVRLQEEAREISQAIGYERGFAWSTGCLGILAMRQTDWPRARSLLEESVRVFRRIGSNRDTAQWEMNFGEFALETGDVAEGLALLEGALAVQRELGDRRVMPYTLMSLGAAALRASDYDRAATIFDEAASISRNVSMPMHLARALRGLGRVRLATGDLSGAAALLTEALVAAHADPEEFPLYLEAHASLAAALGDTERSAELFGAAEALRERTRTPRTPAGQSDHERDAARARLASDAVTFQTAWTRGRGLTSREAAALALRPCVGAENPG